MKKTTEELAIENENLKQGNIKVWEQLEKSTEILSHHEAYISLLEEENVQLKELLKRARGLMNYTKDWACSDATEEMITKINQALGEE